MSKFLPKNNLLLLRKEKNLTQTQLADKIGVSLKTYREYEIGKQLPKSDVLIALADFFGVSTDFILGRSNCRSVKNDYISQITGLNDNAINVLEINQNAEIRANTDPIPHVYHSIGTLNALFSQPLLFDMLLNSIQDLLNSQYRYPVFHTGQTELITDKYGNQVPVAQAIVPNNEIDLHNAACGDMAILHLAKDKNTPWENHAIPIDDNFLEDIALKEIEKNLLKIKQSILDNTKK